MRQVTKAPIPIDDPAPNPDPALLQAARERHLTIDPSSLATVGATGFKLSVARVTSKPPAAGHGGGEDVAFAHVSAPGSKLPEGYYRVVALPDGTPAARLSPDLKNGILYVKVGDVAPSAQEAARPRWWWIIKLILFILDLLMG